MQLIRLILNNGFFVLAFAVIGILYISYSTAPQKDTTPLAQTPDQNQAAVPARSVQTEVATTTPEVEKLSVEKPSVAKPTVETPSAPQSLEPQTLTSSNANGSVNASTKEDVPQTPDVLTPQTTAEPIVEEPVMAEAVAAPIAPPIAQDDQVNKQTSNQTTKTAEADELAPTAQPQTMPDTTATAEQLPEEVRKVLSAYDSFESTWEAARAAFVQGNYTQAQQIYDALAIFSAHPDVLGEYGNLMWTQGHKHQAHQLWLASAQQWLSVGETKRVEFLAQRLNAISPPTAAAIRQELPVKRFTTPQMPYMPSMSMRIHNPFTNHSNNQ